MTITRNKFTELFCVTLIGLMWVWPFLYYKHAFPITTFYQEWGAALLGFTACFVILIKGKFWQQAEVPRIILLPLGIAVIVAVQSAIGLIPVPEQSMLVMLYLLWAALLTVCGFYLGKQIGLPLLATILAFFLVLGTELSALIGILQHFKWHTFLDPYLTTKLSLQVYGNLGQPNHYANYVTLGIISLLYLNQKKRLPTLSLIFLALPLLFVIALSGSRSSWIYFILIGLLSFFFQKRDAQSSPPLRNILFLFISFLMINGLLSLSWFASAGVDNLTPIERMYSATHATGSVGSSDYGGSIRLYLWHEAILMFLQSPLFGIGFGQFAWHHFDILPSLQATHIQGLYNNAHNLIFQLAAETGIAGLFVLFSTLILWFRRSRLTALSLEAWWGYGVLSVLLVHSLLEYPLWYAYFIGIAAFLLGMFDTGSFHLRKPILYRIPTVLLLLFGVASIQQLYGSYQLLENALAVKPTSATDNTYISRVWVNLAQVQKTSVFRPYAETFMGLTMDGVSAPVENKLALSKRIIKFSPNSALVYRYALMLIQINQIDEAKRQITRSIWSYPEGFDAFRIQLDILAKIYPERFSDILKFSDEEYGQRQLPQPR